MTSTNGVTLFSLIGRAGRLRCLCCREPPGPIGVLEVLTVAEGSRSLGVGSQLMEAVRRELARLGASTLELRVLAGNDEAMRFYERQGLRPVRVVFMGPVAVDEEGAVRAD